MLRCKILKNEILVRKNPLPGLPGNCKLPHTTEGHLLSHTFWRHHTLIKQCWPHLWVLLDHIKTFLQEADGSQLHLLLSKTHDLGAPLDLYYADSYIVADGQFSSRQDAELKKKPCTLLLDGKWWATEILKLLQTQYLETGKPFTFCILRCDYLIQFIDLHGKESDLVVQLEWIGS